MTNNTDLKIIKLTSIISAKLAGIDFSKPLSQKDYDDVYEALIEHQVIFFRNQLLTPETHKVFGRTIHSLVKKHPITGKPFYMLIQDLLIKIVGRCTV